MVLRPRNLIAEERQIEGTTRKPERPVSSTSYVARSRSRGGSPAASASDGQRLDIQGLRAVAVLLVMIYHAGIPLQGGFIGVDVFFVVSGFVITAMLMRERDRGRVRFARFYVRRFKRLAPALALVTVFTITGSAFLLSPLGSQQDAALTALGATTFVANLVIARTTGGYFDAPAEANPLLHTWSLSVEEQFYFVFPLLLVLCWGLHRVRRRRVLPMLVVSVVALGSLTLAVVGAEGFRASSSGMLALLNLLLGFYSPVTRVWEFAAGALVALAGVRVSAQLAGPMAALGLAVVAVSAALITAEADFPGLVTVPLVVGTVILLQAGYSASNPVSSALAWRPLVVIGDWSYSLYLWHWPFVAFARILWPDNAVALVIAVVLSVIPAYASYRWVESPLRAMPLGSRRITAAFVAVVVVPPIAVASALLGAAGQGFWSPTVRMYQAAVLTEHAGETAGCDSFVPLSANNSEACTWNGEAPGAPIYLLGDSNADQFSEAVIGAGRMLARPVTISTTSNCPFLDAHFYRDSADRATNERCRDKVQGTIEHLGRSEPGLVVIAAADSYWENPGVRLGVTADSVSGDTRQKFDALRAGLAVTVATLEAKGHQVVLVQAFPERRQEFSWDPTDCRLTDMLVDDPERCGGDMPLDVAVARQESTREVLADVSASTGASIIDTGPVICPGGVCSIEGDGFVRMKDSGHISVFQSEALAELFAKSAK